MIWTGPPFSVYSHLRRTSLPRLSEISQIRRRLILAGRHQIAVAAQEIVFLTNDDVIVVFRAVVLVPPIIGDAQIRLGYRPRPGECMVDDRDLVVHHVLVGFVEIDTLLNDRLIVGVQRKAARLQGTWTF